MKMAFGSMDCNVICLLGGLDTMQMFDSILSVMQYHVIRYRPIHH